MSEPGGHARGQRDRPTISQSGRIAPEHLSERGPVIHADVASSGADLDPPSDLAHPNDAGPRVNPGHPDIPNTGSRLADVPRGAPQLREVAGVEVDHREGLRDAAHAPVAAHGLTGPRLGRKVLVRLPLAT